MSSESSQCLLPRYKTAPNQATAAPGGHSNLTPCPQLFPTRQYTSVTP